MTVTDPEQVEYLYSIYDPNWDEPFQGYAVKRHRIIRKTPKRIHYIGRHGDRTHQVDRQLIEATGEVWDRVHHRTLYLYEPEVNKPSAPVSLADLKQAMAAAHPDRGGTDAEFIAARARYERARSLTERKTA